MYSWTDMDRPTWTGTVLKRSGRTWSEPPTPPAHRPRVQVHSSGTIVHVWQAWFAICEPQGFWLRWARTLEHMYTFSCRISAGAAAVWVPACVNEASHNQRRCRRSKSHFQESLQRWAEQSLEQKLYSISLIHTHTNTHGHTHALSHAHTCTQEYVLWYSGMCKISLLAN